MLDTKCSFFILAVFCLVGWSTSRKCPARYLRFSPQHSFCLSKNPSCRIMRRGVSEQDKQLILKVHNQYRSKVAMGKEDGAIGGRLPPAANMMQMEWDDELAAVAQKWTQNCHWGHDCDECNAVESFTVGQNLVINSDPSHEPDWTASIASLYNEVHDYHTSWLGRFKTYPGPITGHFTQVVWAKSWKVGCGYSHFKKAGEVHQYYACNYGLAGNVNGRPVYEAGTPCTDCPTNTQCSTSSRGGNSFPGLCKMDDPNTAPVYPKDPERHLFYCSFSKNDGDCQNKVSGDGRWKVVQSVGGNYYSVVLKGGQSTTLAFNNPITPRGEELCIILTFRKGPLVASRGDQSRFQVTYTMEGAFAPPSDLETKTTIFMDMKIKLPLAQEFKQSFTFSVPRGAGKHVLDIRKIVAFDGECP